MNEGIDEDIEFVYRKLTSAKLALAEATSYLYVFLLVLHEKLCNLLVAF